MIERTLVLLKPDAVQRSLIGEIITRFERSGMKIVASKMTIANKNMASDHYIADEEYLLGVGNKAKSTAEKRGEPVTETALEIGTKIRNMNMDYLTMSPVFAIILEGHDAIAHVRKLVGNTEPKQAFPGTIRGDYSFDTYKLGDVSKRPTQNLIHASDSVEAAEREISVWFKPEEIHSWKKIDEAILYRGLNDKK